MGILEHLESIGDEIASVRAWQGRRARVQARTDSFTDDDVIRMSQFSRTYPQTPFGILEGLAKEAFPLDHPVVQAMTRLNYHRNTYEAGGAATSGSTITGRLAANIGSWSRQQQEQIPGPYTPKDSQVPGINTATLPRRLLLLEKARLADRVPLPYEQILRRQGLLDAQGNIVRPAREKYKGRGPDGKPIWEYDSPEDAKRDRLFKELMSSVASDQGTKEPIPFLNQDGEQSLYYPRTGETSTLQGPDVTVDIPGPVDELWDRGRRTVEDWFENYRPPSLPGARDVQVGGYSGSSGREIVQVAGMAANAPWQEAQGAIRNVRGELQGQDVDWGESQSDFGIFVGGGDKSPGGGYFVDHESEVATERREREASRGLIGGHSVTAGRWLADSMNLSVDSKPFDLVSGALDFSLAVFDPVAMGALGTSRVSAARRLFNPEEMTGLFSGVRRQFHGPTWNAYRQSDKGEAIYGAIVKASGDKSSPYDYWVAMNRKVDPRLAADLYDADDFEKIDDVFNGVIGTQIRSPHDLDMLPYRLDPESLARLDPRYASRAALESVQPKMLPDYDLDPTNLKNAATNMENWLRAGKAGDTIISDTFNMIARAESKNGVEQAVEYAMKAEDGVLAAAGVGSPQKRRELTRLWQQTKSRALDSLMDEIGADTPTRDLLMANGIAVQDLSPQLSVEYLQNKIPLPDIDRVRRVVADPKHRWLLTSMNSREIGKPRAPEAALQWIVEKWWKPGMLLGRFPAWITRVVGEEQIRMVQAGVNGIFNHPLSAMAISVGRKIKTTPTGGVFDDLHEYEAALTRTHGGNLRRPGAVRMAPTHFDKSNLDQTDDFLNAFADQVAMLNYDPVSRTLINTSVDETVDWLKGPGRAQLRMLREAEPQKFRTDAQIREYLTSTLGERIRIVTNNNPELLDAIRNGKLGDVPMFRKGGPKLNRQYVSAMNDYLDDAPRLVKGFEPISGAQTTKWDAALDWMFANTMSRATNFASRSPFFKQKLWEQTADLMPYVNGSTRLKVLGNLDEANLSRGLLKRIKKQANIKGDTKITSVEELETLAAGYALDETKKTLYDLASRGQLADSLRILAPFGNAYQELITTWPKLLVGEKYGWIGKFASVARASRRVQQTIEGGRRNGWFMKNQFGEEVFVFPFSAAFTEAVTGVPVPMTGRVQGLNMMFDVLPGMGPVAAVPVAWMLEGKPGTWQDVYDQLLPYGAPGERKADDLTNWLSYAPSWIQKLAIAGSAGPPPGIDNIPGIEHIWPTKDEVLWDNNAFMNVQKDVMKYLLSTGEYDVSTREGMLELTEAAHDKAKDLYYIRAASQFFAPTAPTYEFLAQDPSGHTLAQWVVQEEYYNLLDEGASLDEATEEIMDKYGPDIMSLTVPKTQAATYNVPRSREAGEWLQGNKDIRTKFPGVYGLFAPQGDDLDYSVLLDQYASGEVDVLTPTQWLNLRNDMMKSLEYNYYKDQVGNSPTEEEERWLRQIRSELEESYPSSTSGLQKKPENEELIAELYQAIDDPKLRDSDVASATREYFYYRDQAQQFAVDSGYAGFARPNALLPTREWLSGIALDIAKDYPEFELVWTTVLSREFEKELR